MFVGFVRFVVGRPQAGGPASPKWWSMRRAPMRLLPILLIAALVAGCMSPASNDTDPATTATIPTVSATRLEDPAMDFSGVVVGDHGFPGGHSIRALHGGSHLLELVGYNDLTDKLPVGAVGTGWSAAGIWHNWVCVAQFAGTGALAIVDIADPTKPTVVSQVGDASVNGDCQFTSDGNYLFAGAYIGVAEPDVPLEGNPQGSSHTDGLNIWDVSDKANPRHLLYSDTGTYHTLMLHTDPDTNVTYLIQAYSGNIYRFDAAAPGLTLVNTTTPMDHDMWVAKHPITGQYLLYSGAGRDFIVYDFDDPEHPEEIAVWAHDEETPGSAGWHRQATVDQLIDGRAIIAVAGENCGGGETLPYAFVDITDPASPTTMSHWEVPGKPISTDAAHLCEMSPHEFSTFDGYVATGNYHAGVWLIDIGSAERLVEPVTLGYYIPANEPATQGNPGLGAQDLTSPWNPFVWGAFFDERGYIIVGDFSSGLYVLKVPGVTHEV